MKTGLGGGGGFALPIRIWPVIGMSGRRETCILISASLSSALEKLLMNNLYIGKYDLCDAAKVCEAQRDLLRASYKC